MKGVQCYELFGGKALKIHTFSFFHFQVAQILYQGEQTSEVVSLHQIIIIVIFKCMMVHDRV